ncbi:uncharacterized protein LOC133277925 isoform X1 [Pezoporus flaviventris]|uniref:uncharacterized protein LOC133277925 isoform X1 n=1 Tax=Pezoporus flaviventris TaxID=889875 RepID=UPI002AB0548E|nr:uncharacterized protein LOC133277925 isoform X1 [Pezoporus flaviventris]
MLLPFINIKHPAVCERAVARIAKLADLMASSSSVQVGRQAPSSQAVSHSLPTVGSSLRLKMPEAFSTALPWARVSASLFPMFFPPQCPFCQQPSWPPVLCRSALPKEHGGRPGLAALPARLPSSLLWEGPAQLRPSRILPWGSLRFGAFVALLPLSPSTCPASLAQVWSLLGHDHSSSHYDISKDRLLGQLLGRLIVCWTSKIWAIQQEALVALHHLSIFIQHQKCMTSPQPDNCHDHPEHPQDGGKREAGKPSCLSLCSTISMAKVMSFFLAGPLVWGIRTRLV